MYNKKPYGNTVKPVIMKYYAIYISKWDWNDLKSLPKEVACICSETCRPKHFVEEIAVTKEIYPEDHCLRDVSFRYEYIGIDGLLHIISCERVDFYDV